MRIRFNEDKKVVEMVKEGLKKKGGYCPCRLEKMRIPSACARNSGSRLRMRTLRDTAIAGFIIRKNRQESKERKTGTGSCRPREEVEYDNL